MATLTIRDFPDQLRNRLQKRAAASKRSMEAEVRFILTRALEETVEQVGEVLTKAKSESKGFEEPAKKWKGRRKRASRRTLDLLSAHERKVLAPEAQRALQKLREMWGVRDKDPNKSDVDEFLAERSSSWGEKS